MPLPMQLTTPDAVEATLVRPLTAQETGYIDSLIDQASALLRTAAPSVDARIARFVADPTDTGGLDPQAVAAELAGVIKQVLVNPNSLTSQSDTAGPFAHTESYALRGDSAAMSRGVLRITPENLAVLFPARKRLRAGTIRTRPNLAPRPVGRYGPFGSVAQAVEAIVTFAPDSASVLMDEASLSEFGAQLP